MEKDFVNCIGFLRFKFLQSNSNIIVCESQRDMTQACYKRMYRYVNK